MISHELKAAVRSMLVPVSPQVEDRYLEFVGEYLAEQKVAEADRVSWIAVQLRRWKTEKKPSQELRKLIKDALFNDRRNPQSFMFDSYDGPSGEAYAAAARLASQRYFNIHKALTGQHLFEHDAARQLMSHMGIIARLSIDERMTASEISRIIGIRDRRFELNWRALKAIMSQLGFAPSLSVRDVEATYREDTDSEASLFGDLDIGGSIRRIAEIAADLGCPGDFERWLEDLIINDLHPPFLLLLHYQLLVQEHFDHAVTYAYEFSPRGQPVAWLTEKYIDAGIAVQRNAYLNNAKAALRFDKAWAIGRTDSLRAAHALANILEQFESLGVLAKDELAAQIRGLLHRYIRVKAEETAGGIPEELGPMTMMQANALLDAVRASNTQTTGIVEQRLVDCLGCALHRKEHGWSAKGVGDSVFAANVFRKKFGDCEFERPNRPAPEIVAYESHGGKLTRPYLDDHIASFQQVLEARKDELEAVEPLSEWSLKVVFVAHESSPDLPDNYEIEVDGGALDVEISTLSFGEAGDTLLATPDGEALINKYLVERLNDRFVHPRVRATAKALAGI